MAKLKRTRNRRVPRPPISQPGRLKKYSNEHLVYELQLFFGAMASFSVQLAATHDRALHFFHMARVEAFANHLRNLITFLFPDEYPLQKDDVAAHHFMPGAAPYATWINSRPKLSRSLRRAKTRADKELAHLTSKRIAGARKQKEWDVCGLGDEIRALLTTFAAAADPNRLGSQVRKEIPAGVLPGCGSQDAV